MPDMQFSNKVGIGLYTYLFFIEKINASGKLVTGPQISVAWGDILYDMLGSLMRWLAG